MCFINLATIAPSDEERRKLQEEEDIKVVWLASSESGIVMTSSLYSQESHRSQPSGHGHGETVSEEEEETRTDPLQKARR